MNIILDTREKDLITLMPELQVKQLDIGDILFIKNDISIAIIERKTYNDFKASLRDGRYREQKARLEECCKGMQVYYIIEGKNSKSKYDKTSDDQLLGAFVSIMAKSNIFLYQTESINETVNFIRKLEKKLLEIDTKPKMEYIQTLQPQKGRNISVDDSMILMLCRIPGISIHIAREIKNNYKSITNLCNVYTQCIVNKDNPELLLTKIKVNSRAISHTVSKNVFAWLN